MIKPRHKLTLLLLAVLLPLVALAQPDLPQPKPDEEWIIEALTPEGQFDYDAATGVATGTNGLLIKFGGAVMTADRAAVNQETGEAEGDGNVRIQRDDQIWAGEHIRYNFKTRQMEAQQFRTGKTPVFAEGKQLRGDVTNSVYIAEGAYVTTDDVSEPFTKIRANRLKIVPGKYVQAQHAVLYLGGVPAFYFPYYRRNLGERANNWNFTPGYRSKFGPFLYSTYEWFLSEQVDGALHLDYRAKRGPGLGPDINAHLGRWGDAKLKYYYLYDEDPGESDGVTPPHNRQRVSFNYASNPFTNLYVKAAANYQSDSELLHDFFDGDYREDPQPKTFVDVNRLWDNFSLETYVQPRVNDFYETVERLPEVKLTGFRQQVGPLPVYYESESSAGWYRREFAEITNSFPATNNFSAARADTYHQLTLPHTFFGWLNIAPRVGGRFTYYSHADGDGATTHDEYRSVFNTGAETTLKASRLWSGAQNKLLEVDGLRHIVEPSINYVFVPDPSVEPPKLPQFDYELPSLRLLPIEYPDYNSIDSIQSQNVFRFGLRNKFQTKREGRVVNLLNWNVYTDWNLNPHTNQTTFSDLFSDLSFRPRSWISLESQTRYDIDSGEFNLAFHTLTLHPGERWSWGVSHYYLRTDDSSSPTAWGPGNNLISSTIFHRLNENWATRVSHRFEAQDGRLEEQLYTLYRDFRSWTGALTFRVREDDSGSKDYTVAFTFSLKARPRFAVGGDAVRPEELLGN